MRSPVIFIEIDVGIGRQISFMHDDSIRDLLGFKPKIIHEEHNLSDYPVDILSFDNIFLECDTAKGMIYKEKRSGIFIILLRMLIRGSNTLKIIVEGCIGMLWIINILFLLFVPN